MRDSVVRVLWHINNMVPLGANRTAFVNEGWISGLALNLVKSSDVELIICYGQNYSQNIVDEYIGKIRTIGYYNENILVYHEELKDTLKDIVSMVCPDVVHIMGTEYPHSLSIYYACEMLGIISKVVVSVQGIVSECAEMYTFGIPDSVAKRRTIKDITRNVPSIFDGKKAFEYQGRYEVELFSKDVMFLGRTEWDKQCLTKNNTKVRYRYSGEILRESFYNNRWSIDSCQKKSIFISQANYPIKGFHVFLKAVSKIREKYPDVQIYVAGRNPLVYHTKRINMGMYERYCYTLIKRARATNNIHFLGALEEKQMVEQYLKANVFVSPSVLENSCNSVGEAMIMGVPTISSNVGGIASLIDDGVNGFCYPLNNLDVLVDRISQIFEDDNFAMKLSEAAIKKAQNLHNIETIVSGLLKIYNEVNNSKND